MFEETLSALQAQVDRSPFKGYIAIFIAADGSVHFKRLVSLLRVANRRKAYQGCFLKLATFVASAEPVVERNRHEYPNS